MVKDGAITKVQDSAKSSSNEKPEEQVVYELDDSAYTDLQAKVGAAVELVKANKLNIFKQFAQVGEHVQSLSNDQLNQLENQDSELLKRRD